MIFHSSCIREAEDVPARTISALGTSDLLLEATGANLLQNNYNQILGPLHPLGRDLIRYILSTSIPAPTIEENYNWQIFGVLRSPDTQGQAIFPSSIVISDVELKDVSCE
jgi:hypothetical protein